MTRHKLSQINCGSAAAVEFWMWADALGVRLKQEESNSTDRNGSHYERDREREACVPCAQGLGEGTALDCDSVDGCVISVILIYILVKKNVTISSVHINHDKRLIGHKLEDKNKP